MVKMFHDIQQNTDEWLDLRIGKLTGSAISKVMAQTSDYKVVASTGTDFQIIDLATYNLRAKKYSNKIEATADLKKIISSASYAKRFGEPAKQLAVDIAIEQLTGKSHSDGYTNAHMERGHEQEPLARLEYESQFFSDVSNGGFFDNGFTGCSPDGLVFDDGLVEIKSVIPSVHYERIRTGKYDSSYQWQLMFNLKETKREWIDFVSYCQAFTEKKKLIVFRLWKDNLKDEFEKIDIRVDEFKKLVDEIKNRIGNE